MKKLLTLAAVALLLSAAGFVRADEVYSDCAGLADCCDTADNCCVTDCCAGPRGGIVGGVDFTIFKMYGAAGAGGDSAAGNFDDYFPDYGFRGQGRYWIGYELSGGLGLRGRAFRWQASEEYLGLDREQEIEIYDIETTVDMSCMGWDFTGFGGIRWGSIELDGSDFGEPNPMNFEGAGMTLGFDFRRCVWGNLAIVGGARYSVLYGETNFAPVAGGELDNTFVDITEVRLGVEWSRMTRFGGRLFASATWEQQVYGTDTYFPFAIDPETAGDVSLAGPVFSIGFDR